MISGCSFQVLIKLTEICIRQRRNSGLKDSQVQEVIRK